MAKQGKGDAPEEDGVADIEKSSIEGTPFRMDFEMQVLETDEESHTFRCAMIPNPERYQKVERDGKTYYLDKFDNILISLETLAEGMKHAAGTPIFFSPPLVKDGAEYVASRKNAIREGLRGDYEAGDLVDAGEDFLKGVDAEDLKFVIASIDLVGSTKLAKAVTPEQYRNILTTLSQELAAMIPLFRGHVLKFTGDGVIAYFPEPDFISKNDLAADCSLGIMKLVYAIMNPILVEMGLPAIDLRIGLESGRAFVVTVGHTADKKHKDIIGEVVNITTKVERLASPGCIVAGEVCARNMHVQWRRNFVEIETPADWPYHHEDRSYRVFQWTPNGLDEARERDGLPSHP